MSEPIEKKMQREKSFLSHLHQKTIVRVWNLAKRLNPKSIRREGKKDHFFKKLNNKGRK